MARKSKDRAPSPLPAPSSPLSTSSSDLYAEEDSTVPVPVPRLATASPASDHMYDDSPVPSPVQSKGKRRLDSNERESEPIKRRKLVYNPELYFSGAVPQTAGLPAEIWQHIFLCFAPDDLSRCLRVSRNFKTYLTTLTASMSGRLPPRRVGLKLIDSEAIWTSSRKIFAPNLPRPLAGFTEMHMFQLLGGRRCQGCACLPKHPIRPNNTFNAGPGPDGVRIIWNFSARLCAKCFESLSVKDVDVLVSPAAPLRAGLPHAFRTPDLHYIPPTLQSQAASSIKGTMAKVYSTKHIDDLQQEHQNALEFGEAAAEEWLKGLPLLGKQQMADAARWERWEALLALGSDIPKVLGEYFRPSSAPSVDEAPVAAPPANGSSLPVPAPAQMKHPLPARVVAAGTTPASQKPAANGQSPQQQPKAQWRPPRNLKEVNEAKAIRRAEIEMRCQDEFEPPLMPNVLQHMESFNAAMQITTPLTDNAWEVLKPRLYNQRDAAEQIEYLREEQLRALQATIPDPSYQQALSKGASEAADRQWETAQVPIRKQLGSYAEEMVRTKWNNGKSLNRDTCPVFAVEVLLFARNKFFEVNQSQEPPSGPDTSSSDPAFVSLENMRWLFENKVKPVTEKHCRELFQCTECDGSRKSYAFEGMIQHYGAKHTTDFSKGNIVVHWQSAEWPEDPPFEPSNGQVADPTIPQKFSTKKDSKKSGKRHDQASQPVSNSQNGAPWPGVAASGPPPQPAHAIYQGYQVMPPAPVSYSSETQAAQLPYGHPYGQPTYPVETAFYRQEVHPPATAAPPTTQPFGTHSSTSYHQDQVNDIAIVANEIWGSLAGVEGLEESVKLQTLLHHVVSTFRSRYGSEPSLDSITDALANHVLMRSIKDASGIACKTCISSRLDGSMAYQPYAARVAASKLYNTFSLVIHFKTVHLQSVDDSSLDWKEDMIELPEDTSIRELLRAVGMNDDKLAVISQAFPSAFPKPLPRIGEIKNPAISARKQDGRRPSQNQKKNKKSKRNSAHRLAHGGLDETHDSQSDALPEAADDEYDPRRPAFIETMNHGHSHVRRSFGDAAHPIQPSASLPNLAPETIAALSRLYPSNPEVQKVLAPRAERSPSVPRAGGPGSRHPHDQSRHFRNTHESNHHSSQAVTQGQSGRGSGGHGNGRNGRAHREEPSEDYTQIIRTPASGPYEQQTISAHPHPTPPNEQYIRLDPYGRPYEHPRYEPAPYAYGYDPRAGHPEHHPHPDYRVEQPPVPYGYEPRPETVYVDEYGRPVEVVRVVERHPPPMYDYPAHQPEYLRRDDPQRRYVYYEQAPLSGPSVPPSGYTGPPRDAYEDMHGGAPRYV